MVLKLRSPTTESLNVLRRLRSSARPYAIVFLAVFLILVVILNSPNLSLWKSSDRIHFDSITTLTRRDWSDGPEAEQCIPIFEKLRKYGLLCGIHSFPGSCLPKSKRRPLVAGNVWMFSQFGQDTYLYMNHFNSLKRPGVYIDIASHDPVKWSNTYFYDRCLGWKGVCVEGNPKYYEPTFRDRSCQLVPTCAGKKDGQVVQFALREAVGGILGSTFKHTEKFNSTKLLTVEEKCTTVETILDRMGVQRVDYMSLDVEGHEYEVLQGINWDKVRIDVLTVEVSGDFRKIETWLENLGYTRHKVGAESKRSKFGRSYLGLDAIFIRNDVKFGEAI